MSILRGPQPQADTYPPGTTLRVRGTGGHTFTLTVPDPAAGEQDRGMFDIVMRQLADGSLIVVDG